MKEQSESRQGHGWVLIGGCAVVTLCLGYIGFRHYHMANNDPQPPLTLLYLALQLFTLESGSVTGPVPLTLEVARLAAPMLSFWAGIKVLFRIFRAEFEIFRLRLFRDHVVVCGLGEKAYHYIQSFLASSSVVVIELNADNEWIASARVLGARVIIGDARLGKVLAQAKVGRARILLSATGDDLANMEIAERARVIPRGKKAAPLHCYIHIADPQTLKAAKVHERLWERTGKYIPNVFSFFQLSARALFETRPLDWRPITRESQLHAHLIVIGFGKMGENVFLQAVRIGHFANRKKLRVTIVDRAADTKWNQFKYRYPNIEKICVVDRLKLEADDPLVVEAVRKIARDEKALVSTAICFDSDEKSLSYAVGLREKMDELIFPISVRMPRDSLLCKALLDGGSGKPGRDAVLASFGTCGDCCTVEWLTGEARDTIARQIHEGYLKMVDPRQRASDPALQDWDMLREDFRESNRQQAGHLPVKLRAVGFNCRQYSPGEERDAGAFDLSAEEIETLAIMEHNRYNAERLLSGWRKGPVDKVRKITPYLVEWEELPDDIKERDLVFIRNIPNLVKVWWEKSLDTIGY